ncbi:MAG TPA: M2 family metallopeptidase [Bryobacteraceae bacterium]|nr:M2 family metallopeptidase [Bryobacteraceae bacterium]
MRTLILRAIVPAALLVLAGCSQSKPSADDAKKFTDAAEVKLNDLGVEAARAAWVQENFITDDTEALSAAASQRSGDEAVRLAKQAKQFDGVQVSADVARKLNLLKIGFTLAPPSDPKESAEVSRIAASLDATYGKGKYCKGGGSPDKKETCLDINDITKIMASSTNPAELLDVWKGWNTISLPMRKDFTRFVELSIKGAVELGF